MSDCIICLSHNENITHDIDFYRHPSSQCKCKYSIDTTCMQEYIQTHGNKCLLCKNKIVYIEKIVNGSNKETIYKVYTRVNDGNNIFTNNDVVLIDIPETPNETQETQIQQTQTFPESLYRRLALGLTILIIVFIIFIIILLIHLSK